jgi:Fe-S-cluster containining protein
MIGRSLPADPVRRPLDAAFSYACHRCRRCSHDKLIQVNPYEIARLARNRGMGTTAFIEAYLDEQPYLRRGADGACVFLGPEGCTVHPDRPLVCRVYPLGRHVRSDGRVEYSKLDGDPRSAGVFGLDGTIAAYLADQKVEDFARAADRYLAVLQRLYDSWCAAPPAGADGVSGSSAAVVEAQAREDLAEDPPPELLDLDRAVAEHCRRCGLAEPSEVDARMELHLAAIDAWLDRQH